MFTLFLLKIYYSVLKFRCNFFGSLSGTQVIAFTRGNSHGDLLSCFADLLVFFGNFSPQSRHVWIKLRHLSVLSWAVQVAFVRTGNLSRKLRRQRHENGENTLDNILQEAKLHPIHSCRAKEYSELVRETAAITTEEICFTAMPSQHVTVRSW